MLSTMMATSVDATNHETLSSLGRRVLGGGHITRDDVAATLLVALDAPNTIGKTFEELEGDTPIEEAVRSL